MAKIFSTSAHAILHAVGKDKEVMELLPVNTASDVLVDDHSNTLDEVLPYVRDKDANVLGSMEIEEETDSTYVIDDPTLIARLSSDGSDEDFTDVTPKEEEDKEEEPDPEESDG